MQYTLIGIGGTNGSGKDTIGTIMAEKYNFLFISVTELLRNELKRRGLPVERVYMRTLSAEWRRACGYGVLIDRAVEVYEKTAAAHQGLVIASLRHPGEADRLHELSGHVWWIDADPLTRYQRIQAHADSRGRMGEDDKTYKQFIAEEAAEMHRSGDTATLDMSAVKARADVTLINENQPLDALEVRIARLIAT